MTLKLTIPFLHDPVQNLFALSMRVSLYLHGPLLGPGRRRVQAQKPGQVRPSHT